MDVLLVLWKYYGVVLLFYVVIRLKKLSGCSGIEIDVSVGVLVVVVWWVVCVNVLCSSGRLVFM